MFVCASTDCFPELSLEGVMQRLVDLEYTSVEVAIRESGEQLKPSQVLADLEHVIAICRQTQRLDIAAYTVDMPTESPDYYPQFEACCRLAKATKVVSIAVPAAELGTPFNAEIERLRELAAIASREGVVVGLITEAGKMTEDPTTATVLCDNVKGLGLTLDPTAYTVGPSQGGNYEQIFRYVNHVHLRDSTKTKAQVRIGQGEIEYGRLIALLAKVRYNRALSVNIAPMDDVDQSGEMRKMRLLLESLL